MPDIFNKSVEATRFSIANVYKHVLSQDQYRKSFFRLKSIFTEKELFSLFSSLIRFAYFIEPVKQPTIDSTKFAVRWSERIENDPRFSSFEECASIFDYLVSQIEQECQHQEQVDILKLVLNHGLISYEINLDYLDRSAQSIHNRNNIYFFADEEVQKTYLLRKYLLNSQNHKYIAFFREMYNKVATKSFLTDRVLTGLHKTNREKRWECHPQSVHFAMRKECLAIELKLIEQICHLVDFPSDLKALLEENQIVNFKQEITKCPITLEPLLFEKFNDELINPTHGKASIQVGHIHPLKAGENAISGHTANNISWISSIGNRIQGDLSVEETQKMIFRIIENYGSAGLIN